MECWCLGFGCIHVIAEEGRVLHAQQRRRPKPGCHNIQHLSLSNPSYRHRFALLCLLFGFCSRGNGSSSHPFLAAHRIPSVQRSAIFAYPFSLGWIRSIMSSPLKPWFMSTNISLPSRPLAPSASPLFTIAISLSLKLAGSNFASNTTASGHVLRASSASRSSRADTVDTFV